MNKLLMLSIVLGIAIVGCKKQSKESESMENPFLKEWTTPFGVPPFDEIQEKHFLPAIEAGIIEQEMEIATIVENAEAPTFDNSFLFS